MFVAHALARRGFRSASAAAVVLLLAGVLVAVVSAPAFAAAPTVTKLALSGGSTASSSTQPLGGLVATGGQTVTITGGGYSTTAGATTVQWGSTTLSSEVTVSSSSSINVVTPPEPPGTVVHVKVTVNGVQSADNPQKNVAGYVGCTFNGNAPNNLISGVVAGSTQIAVDCVNAQPNQSFVLTVASPLAGFVTPANINTQLPLIMGSPTSFAADSTGHLSQNYTVPTTQQGTDPDAVCPPSQPQADVGLLNCAFAVADFSSNNYGDALLAYATGQLNPDVPHLVVNPTTGGSGDSIAVTPCDFSVNPHTGSCGWWGQTAVTPIPAANVSIGGHAATTASLSVTAPVYAENSTHNGGTLTGGALSGTFSVPAGAPGGAQTLKIDEPNGSFNAGNGPGNTVEGSTAFTVTGVTPAPTVTGVSPTSGSTAGGNTVTITGTNLTGATAVDFGGTAATGLTNNTATSIQVTAPAHASGTVDVHVTTGGGTSVTNSPADNYTYNAPAGMSCDMGAGVPSKPGKPNKNIGTVKFSPGLTATPSVKNEKIKLSGTLENCTGFEGVASKYPIIAGAFTASIQLPPGATCSSPVSGTPLKTKLTVKWEGINPKTGKLATAAPTDTTTVTAFVQNASPFGFSLTTAPLAGSKSLLLGKTLHMDIVIDQSASDIATGCGAKGGLKLLNFTGVNGPSKLNLS